MFIINKKNKLGITKQQVQRHSLWEIMCISKYGSPNVPGTVELSTGPVSCMVRSEGGTLVRKHHDQLFKQIKPEGNELEHGIRKEDGPLVTMPSAGPSLRVTRPEVNEAVPSVPPSAPPVELKEAVEVPSQPLRRSSRVIKPVVKMNC